MEQYELHKRITYGDIKYCLKNYIAKRLFIRRVGSKGGSTVFNENLEGRVFGVKNSSAGLLFSVEDVSFNFEDAPWGRSFSVGYERNPDERGVIPCLSTGIDPDDPNLPLVNASVFRSANDDYFLQLSFGGKIPLKFHSWWKEPYWKYWKVDREAVR